MQVFKTYFKILNKRKLSIIIYVVLFLAIANAFTSNIKSNEMFKPSKVEIMVINHDGENPFLDGFMTYLEDYALFVEPEEDEDAVREALFYRKAKYILTIPEGFTAGLHSGAQIKLKKQMVPDSIEAKSLDNIVDNYFHMAKVYINQLPNLDDNKLNSYIKKNFQNSTEVRIDADVEETASEANMFNMYFFNFLTYIIIASFITSVSLIMYSFNGLDIRRRHTASPISNKKMSFQLILANMVFVLGFLIIFILAGFDMSKSKTINLNLILVWINAFVFSLTALSISYLIGITVNSRKAIGALSAALSLSLSFLSGVFVPQQYLGSAVLRVASFTPTYWYVKANNTILNVTSLHFDEMHNIYGYMAIQIGFCIAFLSIALVVEKRRRLQAN